METLEFEVIRKFFLPEYTIGNWFTDKVFLCNTMEPTARELHDLNHDGDFLDPGEGKIMGKTAIPCGRYKIEMSWFGKAKRLAPLLKDVQGFTGIFVHALQFPYQTEGCIGPGENKIKGQILYSRYYCNIIENKIREATREEKQCFITIKM
jgi:hypothetical protein